MIEKILFWLLDYGVLLGLPINILVLFWDVPMWVSRGFMEYSIRGKGAFILLLGTILCTAGKITEIWLDQVTE